MTKKKLHIFEPYNNPTFDFIYHNQEKIKVRISWKVGFEFMIEFNIKDQKYSLILPPITTDHKLFCRDDINFSGIELHPIEKDNISRRLNEILNYNFD